MKEEYKKLEDIYSISNFGNVRNDSTGYILKPFIKGRKVVVGLWLYNASQLKQFGIALQVAKSFVDPQVKKVVRIDKNKFNNRVDNLKVYI